MWNERAVPITQSRAVTGWNLNTSSIDLSCFAQPALFFKLCTFRNLSPVVVPDFNLFKLRVSPLRSVGCSQKCKQSRVTSVRLGPSDRSSTIRLGLLCRRLSACCVRRNRGGRHDATQAAAGDHPLTNFGIVERVTSEVSSRENTAATFTLACVTSPPTDVTTLHAYHTYSYYYYFF